MLKYYLALFTQLDLYDDHFVAMLYHSEIVFDDSKHLLNVGDIKSLKTQLSCIFGDLGCIEKAAIMAQEYLALNRVQ